MNENCHVEPIHKTVADDQLRQADHALLSIWGMGCQNCAARVRNGLISLDGVYAVDVYLDQALADVGFDGTKVSEEMLIDAVSRAGNDGHHRYGAQLIRDELFRISLSFEAGKDKSE